MASLDCGCGFAQRGSVNVDLKKLFHPTVVCDGQHLPFKTAAFQKAFCDHVIEHIDNPEKLLDELCRVARIVEVRTPWAYHPYAHLDSKHRHFFTCRFFQDYCKRRGYVSRSVLRFDPDRTFYFFPVEILCYISSGYYEA